MIICKFLSRKVRDNIMYNRNEIKSTTITDLGFSAPTNDKQGKVYINESLSRRSKALFKKVRQKQKELNWKFAWSKNGTIYAGKTANQQSSRLQMKTTLRRK